MLRRPDGMWVVGYGDLIARRKAGGTVSHSCRLEVPGNGASDAGGVTGRGGI